MISPDVTLPSAVRADLLIFINVAFWTFVPISFVYVLRYAVGQHRAGQLINGRNSPPAIGFQGSTGWFFSLGVLCMIFAQSAFYIFLVVLGIYAMLVENGRTATEQFGLARLKPARAVSWSLLLFGAVMLAEVPLVSAVSWLIKAIHLPNNEQETVESFRHITRLSTIILFIVQAAFLSPIIEELFFRGFLMTFLKKYTTTWGAIILSAGVFAFAHANIGVALPLWLLGVALGIAYENTGCLLIPIGTHACWNLITALSILLDKGDS